MQSSHNSLMVQKQSFIPWSIWKSKNATLFKNGISNLWDV